MLYLITAILILIVAGFLILFVKLNRSKHETASAIVMLIGILVIFPAMLCTAYTISFTAKARYYDVYTEQIEVLEEENTKINKEVKEVALTTLDKENEFYDEIINIDTATQNSIQIVMKIPELKSLELIKNYSDLFVKNSNEIKTLKLERAEIMKYKIWLSF